MWCRRQQRLPKHCAHIARCTAQQIKHCHTPSTDVRWVDRCYKRTIHQPTSLVRQSPATERWRMVLFCSISRKNELKMHPVEGLRLALRLISPSPPTLYVIPVIHVTNTPSLHPWTALQPKLWDEALAREWYGNEWQRLQLTRYLMTLLAAIAIVKFNQEARMDTKENTTDGHSQPPCPYACTAYRSCVLLITKPRTKYRVGQNNLHKF